MRQAGDQLLSPSELADRLSVPVSTIYDWHLRGRGPARIKVGRHVRYRSSDIEAWLDANRSTAGTAA